MKARHYNLMRSFKMHLKQLTTACLGLLLVLSSTACHGSQGSAEFVVPEEFDTSKTYELTFWAKNDTNKTQTKIYEQAIKDFQKLYPNIKVGMRLYTDYNKIYNDVITNISTNTTPNICITYPDHIATYLTGTNVVAPLYELFDDGKYGFGGSELAYDSPKKDEVIPEFLEEGIIGDKNYAIPYMRSTEAVYINKTFVEKLGYKVPKVLTWDFVWKVSEAAMKKNKDGTFKVNGQKTMIPFIYKSTDNMMIQMLKQKGADYSTDDGQILLFNDTTKEILKEIAKHGKTGAFSTFKISSYPANFLDAGQCIFAVDSTAGATWMGSHAPLSDISADKFVEFDTEVRMVPQYDTSNPKMISQGPSICIFNKTDPQEVLASWLFAQYLLTDDVQVAYAKTEGYVPVTSKARNTKTYKKYLANAGKDNSTYYQVKIDASQILLNVKGDETFTTPVFVGSASLRDAAGELIESTVKAVRRKATIDDAYLDSLFSDVTSLYRLNQSSASNNGASLGAMPTMSKVLLGAIAVIWVLIGIYVLRDYLNKRKKN